MRCCTGRSLVEGSNEKSDSSTGIPADQVFFKVPILPQTFYSNELMQAKVKINAETTRHLLISFLWVLRHVEEVPLRNLWSELNPPKLRRLLELLFICVSGFEYRGKSGIRHCIQQGGRTTEEVKSCLEDMIVGEGSARSQLVQRRRGNSNFFSSF